MGPHSQHSARQGAVDQRELIGSAMPRRPQSYSVREAVNEHEVQAALLNATKGYGGVVRFAKRVGFSREYVQGMLYGGGRISTRVASALGFQLMWVRREK